MFTLSITLGSSGFNAFDSSPFMLVGIVSGWLGQYIKSNDDKIKHLEDQLNDIRSQLNK